MDSFFGFVESIDPFKNSNQNGADPRSFQAMKRSQHLTQLPSKTEELAALNAEVAKLREEVATASAIQSNLAEKERLKKIRSKQLQMEDSMSETQMQVGVFKHIMPPSLKDHLENSGVGSPEFLPPAELDKLDCKRVDDKTFKWTYKPVADFGANSFAAAIMLALGQRQEVAETRETIVPYWAQTNLPRVPGDRPEPKPVPTAIFNTGQTQHDLETVEGRLASFSPLGAWPHKAHMAPQLAPLALVMQGFHYTPGLVGAADRVSCVSCKCELQGFMANDDVRAMHKAKSPDCKFAKEDAAKPALPQAQPVQSSPPPPPPAAPAGAVKKWNVQNPSPPAVKTGADPKPVFPTLRSVATKRTATAHAPYTGAADDELSFNVGDKLTIFDELKDEPGWFNAEFRGKKGIAPNTHFKMDAAGGGGGGGSAPPPPKPPAAKAAAPPPPPQAAPKPFAAKKTATAHAPYTGAADDELSFNVGDKLTIFDELKDEPGWFNAEFRGKKGIAPNTHFKMDAAGGGGGGGAGAAPVCKAKHAYSTSEPDELSFKAGDVIEILVKDFEPGWHKGKIGVKTGLVPTTHVVFS